MFDRNINEDNTFGLATIPFLPLENPADLDSEVRGDALREPDQLQEPQWWSLGPGRPLRLQQLETR